MSYKRGFRIAVWYRKVASCSLLPSTIYHVWGTAVERFKWKHLNAVATIMAEVPPGSGRYAAN